MSIESSAPSNASPAAPVPNEVRPAPFYLVRALALGFGVLIVFAVNLFLLEQFFRGAFGPVAAQYIYLAIRILGLGFLAYGLTRFALRNRFQTISTVLLVGLVDQVLLKGLWVKRDIAANPANWEGFAPTDAAIFVNMATGYLFFVPIVLILCFVGIEGTKFRKEWTK
jgi:hypothetical protein